MSHVPPLPAPAAKPTKKPAGPVATVLAISFLLLVVIGGVNSIERNDNGSAATAATAPAVTPHAAPQGSIAPVVAAARIKALNGQVAKVEYNDLRTPHLMEVTFDPGNAFSDRQVFTGFAVDSWDVLKGAMADKLIPAGAGMSFTMQVTMVDQYGNGETNSMMTVELPPDVLQQINWSGGFSQYNLLNVSHLAFLRHDINRQTVAFCAGEDAEDAAPFCRQVVAYIAR
jgi:hypothetical protein